MSRVKLAMLGCGTMAGNFMRRFEAVQDLAEMVAFVDPVRDRAASFAQRLEGARAETDFHAVLEDVDAAILPLPHHLHFSVALACLQAGVHVLIEKPMANHEVACKELIDASAATGKVLMVNYALRYHPLVARLKSALDEGMLGDPFQMSIWTEQLTRYPPEHWASRRERLGGGLLFAHGCHYIDLLLWFLGRPVRGVHLGTNRGTPWVEREATSNVTLSFEDEKLGYMFGTWGARGTRLKNSVHVHGTEGMLEADLAAGRLVHHLRGEERVVQKAEAGDHTDRALAHFLDCVQTGKPPLTDGPGSLQGLRVIWRLYEAEQEGTFADLRGLGLDEV